MASSAQTQQRPRPLIHDPVRLMKARLDAHMSRPELAERSGYSTSQIRALELGLSSASDRCIKVIGDALHINPASLLADEMRDSLLARALSNEDAASQLPEAS
jgi:ribosome-binding protein aMBF1 (putative translation factor)